MPTLTDRADLRLTVFGRVLRLGCQADDLPTLHEQWRRCLAIDADERVDHEVVEPREGGRDGYLYAVQMRVTLAAIAAGTGRLLMWHAAGLCDGRGRVVGLVASSGTGKSTATAYLASHGWGYVTDETLACGPDARVWPYPKPLAFRGLQEHKSSVGPDELGLGRPGDGLTLHRMVLLDRRAGWREAPSLTPVPLAEMVLALVEQSSGFLSLDAPLHRLCRVLDLIGGGWRLTYAEIAEAAALLGSLMQRSNPPPGPDGIAAWQSEPADRPEQRGPVDPQGDILWRAPYHDAVACGPSLDEVLVLVGSVPAHLRGIGTDIWRAAGDGIAEVDLVRVIEAVHGPHPDSESLVRAAVDDLVQASVVVRGRRRGDGS